MSYHCRHYNGSRVIQEQNIQVKKRRVLKSGRVTVPKTVGFEKKEDFL